jgi:hypothetical protein
MTNLSKLISVTALIVAGVAQTSLAQTQTDEVMVLNFDLAAVSQGASTTSRDGTTSDVQVTSITSRGIIQTLGTAIGANFSPKARLVVLAPVTFLDDWTIQIQDGTNVTVDVTGFFGHQPGFPSVGGAWSNSRTKESGVTDFSVDTFSLQDQGGYPTLGMHFSVSGFTVLDSRTVLNRKGAVVGQTDSISAQVSGTGDNQGNPEVITGSISAEGIGTQVVSTGIETS